MGFAMASDTWDYEDDAHYFVEGNEVSETIYQKRLNEANEEYRSRGTTLLFESAGSNEKGIGKGYFEALAELESVSLSEDKRINHIAHGAYADLLTLVLRHPMKIPDGEYTIATYYHYMDMNKDGIDELLICGEREEYWQLYTYRNNALVLIYEHDYYHAELNDIYIIDDRYVKVLTETDSMGYQSSMEKYIIFSNSVYVYYKIEWSERAPSETYEDDIWEYGIGYYCNNEVITKDEYEEKIREISAGKPILLRELPMSLFLSKNE